MALSPHGLLARPKRNTPSSGSTDARAVRSGLALRQALLRLLERMSFDQITVRQICAEARVHYATFFRHHPTKEALLDAIARDQIAELIRLTMALPHGEDYRDGFRALCVYVDQHRQLWSTLLNGGAGAAMREEWVRQSRLVAATRPHFESAVPSDLGTICAATLIAETLAWWVGLPRGQWQVAEVAELLAGLVTRAVFTPVAGPARAT